MNAQTQDISKGLGFNNMRQRELRCYKIKHLAKDLDLF